MRVIDYTLANNAAAVQSRYRLVTTFLAPEAAPALELAALYHERWEVESVFDQFKTHMRSASTVLRSKTPKLVRQELWGLLIAHLAIGQLMAQAAWPHEVDPDRLSFTHALRAIKRKMLQAAAFLLPAQLPAWREAMMDEIDRGKCVSSPGRLNLRGVKRKMSGFSIPHRGAALHQKHESTPIFRI